MQHELRIWILEVQYQLKKQVPTCFTNKMSFILSPAKDYAIFVQEVTSLSSCSHFAVCTRLWLRSFPFLLFFVSLVSHPLSILARMAVVIVI